MSTNPDDNPVAAVCGNEVRIYGAKEQVRKGQFVRPLKGIMHFGNYGQARVYAQEYDDRRSHAARSIT